MGAHLVPPTSETCRHPVRAVACAVARSIVAPSNPPPQRSGKGDTVAITPALVGFGRSISSSHSPSRTM
jgi:hypothetical protein